MAISVYPSYLPGFLQSGYSLKTQPNMLRTQMSDGYTRQRVINSGKPAELSVNMSMSGAEYNAFTDWINKNAAGGAAWFMAPVLSSDTGDKEPQYQTVRIQNGAISAALTWKSETETRWKISFILDLATAPLPEADAGSSNTGSDKYGMSITADEAEGGDDAQGGLSFYTAVERAPGYDGTSQINIAEDADTVEDE